MLKWDDAYFEALDYLNGDALDFPMQAVEKSSLATERDKVKTMKTICPNCEKMTEVQFIQAAEEIAVKGEGINVPVEYYRCTECGGEFEDPKSKHDPLALAYKEYRRRHTTTSF